MSDKKTGGPAFPLDVVVDGEEYVGIGMTLRDYFAGQALAGMLPNDRSHIDPSYTLASSAYHIADAMLAEREK